METGQHLRILEAVLFAAAEPLDEATLASRLPNDADVPALLARLGEAYARRGVNLVKSGDRWALRTAPDLAPYLRVQATVSRKLSRAALETLATIGYHQPVTRAEIEDIRGVSTSRGTLDILLETGWVRIGRRRRTPGRPVTWVTTDAFLDHFGLESLDDLPGVDELKAAGLLDKRPAIASINERPIADGGAEDTDEDGDDGEAGEDGDEALLAEVDDPPRAEEG